MYTPCKLKGYMAFVLHRVYTAIALHGTIIVVNYIYIKSFELACNHAWNNIQLKADNFYTVVILASTVAIKSK